MRHCKGCSHPTICNTHGCAADEARANIERARIEAAEKAVIASIPKDLLETLAAANAKFKAEGGCKGCGSTSIGVHYMPCSVSDDDLY